MHFPLLPLACAALLSSLLKAAAAAAALEGTWRSASHVDWSFAHSSSVFTLTSPCFTANQANPAVGSGSAWTVVSFTLLQLPPLAVGNSWSASLNCSQAEVGNLACSLTSARNIRAGINVTWSLRLSFTRALPGSGVGSVPVTCSLLDTGTRAFVDPQRYISVAASSGIASVNLSCSRVTQSEPAVTDGTLAFIPVEVAPIATSPLPSGNAVLLGEWRANRSQMIASLSFSAVASDALLQPRMAGLPVILSPSAVVTLSALPQKVPVESCASLHVGVWGGTHWILNVSSGGSGVITGDCSKLSVTAAVLVGAADPKLLVVAGESCRV
jgi:hypothetical protein